jgi:hypothetical protein
MSPVLGVVRDARADAAVPGVRLQGDAGITGEGYRMLADVFVLVMLVLAVLSTVAGVLSWWRGR